MQQSETLTKFYQEIQQWIDGGFKEHHSFDKEYGICTNLRHWLWGTVSCPDTRGSARQELTDQLKSVFGDTAYPFDFPELSYWDKRNKYTNEKRLRWIKEHANGAN